MRSRLFPFASLFVTLTLLLAIVPDGVQPSDSVDGKSDHHRGS